MALPMDDGEFVIVEAPGATPNASGMLSGPRPLPQVYSTGPALETPPGDLGYFQHSLAKKGKKIQVFVKLFEVEADARLDRGKTIGTITVRNGKDILMCAHSGYCSGTQPERLCLNTEKWNGLALNHLARQIGFRFPGTQRDSAGQRALAEHRGRAHAGHVEVLLACWFVVEITRQECGFENKSEEWIITQLRRLKKLNLGDKRNAFITIDSEPCRTCLQFLNTLTQFTGILFMVTGSRGIGPVQVRVEGQRRQDVIGEVFIDSEGEGDERMVGIESIPQKEATEAHSTDLPDSTPSETTTPVVRNISRRPGSFWKNKAQWTPKDPDKLLSAYKKKTPVYEFPGYNRQHSSPTPASRLQTDDDLNEWQDLGDGLLISRTKTRDDNQESDTDTIDNDHESDASAKKHELLGLDEPSPPSLIGRQDAETSVGCYPNGQNYAQSAYRAIEIEEAGYEVIQRERSKTSDDYRAYRCRDPRPNRMPHNDNMSRPVPHRTAGSLPASGMPRLEEFRHRRVDDYSDESMFRKRYSILRPQHDR